MNEVDLLMKIRIYLSELCQEYEEGCKSILKEMETSRIHHWHRIGDKIMENSI